MAATAGKDGYITVAGSTVAYTDTWALSPAIGTAEITAYQDTSKAYGSTLREWTATFSGTVDRTDVEQAALMDQFEDGVLADIAMRFYILPATYWSGNMRLTGSNINSAVGDKVSVTWNAIGNGNLSYTSS